MLKATDTLKFRLSVYISLTMFLVGMLAACLILLDDWHDRKEEMRLHGMSVARNVAMPSEDELLREDIYAVYKMIEAVKKSEEGSVYGSAEYIEVLDGEGRPIAAVEGVLAEDARAYISARRAAAAEARDASAWSTRLSDGSELVDSAYPVITDGVRIGTVRVGVSDRVLRAAMKRSVAETFGIVLASCLLGVVLGGRIAEWVSRPVSALVKGSEEVSSGNLEYRVRARGPQEVEALAASFNAMAASLKEKVEGLDRAREEAEGLSEKLSAAYNESRLAADRLQQTNDWVTDLAFRLEEANQSLKAEKVQTDTIVHSIREGLVAIDAEERVILVNPEAEDIFEVKEEEVKGEPVKVLVERLAGKVDDREGFIRKLTSSSTPETENAFTITLNRPYKRILRRQSSGIRDEEGNVIGRVVTFRDITREREVDEMKTNFVSTVSHELRTPLTSIKGALNLLLDAQIDDPDTRREFLRIAEQNTDRLISLITTLLDLSRMEEGRASMKLGKLDLNALAASVVKSTDALAKQGGVKLEVSCPDVRLMVLGDKEKLEQVATNLVGNAIKFSDPGATVRVATGEHEGEVRLVVEDEGVGIPKDKLEKVFDRFYQVDMSATRKKGGSGLGLAISRAIVREHGGRIWAESPTSAVGTGARFVVSLPRPAVTDLGPELPSKPAVSETARHARADRNLNTVLVVDSDPGILKVHRRVFELEGYRVLTALTGRDALKLVRESLPGFIFLDVLLPDLDGFDVASIIRGDDATKDIPIVFTTYMDGEDRQKCLALGDGCITKPFQEGELISAVKKILR